MHQLSVKLRQLRKDRKIPQLKVANALNVSKSLVAAFEQGRLIPQPDTAARLDEFFDTGDALRTMSAEAFSAREQERDRQQRDLPIYRSWPEIEASSWLLRNFQPLLVPGLLQTEAYARAVLSEAALSPTEIQRHLTARMTRQEILRGEHPPQVFVVIDQTVLRRAAGGPLVMWEQCQALLKTGELPHVTVQVVPEDAGVYVGTFGPLALATTDQGTYGFMDDPTGGRTIGSPDAVNYLIRTWETVRGYALSQRQSLDLIARMMESWS